VIAAIDGDFAATMTIKNSEQSFVFVIEEFKIDKMRVLLK